MAKKFSKSKVNYSKEEREELAKQVRREGKVEVKKEVSDGYMNDICEHCGRIYCDHEYKY